MIVQTTLLVLEIFHSFILILVLAETFYSYLFVVFLSKFNQILIIVL